MFPLPHIPYIAPTPEDGFVYYFPLVYCTALLLYFLWYLIRLKTIGPIKPREDGDALWLWMHRGTYWMVFGGIPFLLAINLADNVVVLVGIGCWTTLTILTWVALNSNAVADWEIAKKRQARRNQQNGRPRH